MSDEMERYTMRTAVVQDGIWMRAKCLVHADCRLYGRMMQPSGRRVDLIASVAGWEQPFAENRLYLYL